jgi:hypothetical protein
MTHRALAPGSRSTARPIPAHARNPANLPDRPTVSLLLVFLALATVQVAMTALSRNALGALPAEACATAQVEVEIKWLDSSEWHHLARGYLHIRDDGRARRYNIQVLRHGFPFVMIRLPDGGTAGNVPPSLIGALIPHYGERTYPHSVSISVNGEVHERTGDLELRVRREACLQRVE